MYGPERLFSDLVALGYTVEQMVKDNVIYAVIPAYEIDVGRFQGRVIDLGIPSTLDFPRTVAPSIHIRANPQLFEKGSVPNVRNVIDSPLGPEWCYWSRNFGWNGAEKSTRRLMNQIKGIFANA